MGNTLNPPPDDLDGTFEYLPDVVPPTTGGFRGVPVSDTHAEAGSRSASRSQRIDGVLEQVLGDVEIGDLEEVNVPRVLSQWLANSGLQLETAEVSELAVRIHLRLRGGGEVR